MRGYLLILIMAVTTQSACYTGCPDDEPHKFCARQGNKDCGDVTAENQCGEVQTLNCGTCFGSALCGGSGVPNVCSECKKPASIVKDCADGWCKIPAGCFGMGSLSNGHCQPFSHKDCGKETHHAVALTHSFVMMDAEVRQSEFKALLGYSAAKNKNHKAPLPHGLPMEYVTWHEAAAYANALSAQKGLQACYQCSGSGRFVQCDSADDFGGQKIYTCSGYRLPTEGEWEYAQRAGTETDLYNGIMTGCDCVEISNPFTPPKCAMLDEIAWWGGEGTGTAQNHHHPVKQKKPNGWGLYDMVGNVWEWVHDWYEDDLGSEAVVNPVGPASASARGIRGGGWIWPEPRFFRAGVRRKDIPKHNCEDVGFRLVRTLKAGPLP